MSEYLSVRELLSKAKGNQSIGPGSQRSASDLIGGVNSYPAAVGHAPRACICGGTGWYAWRPYPEPIEPDYLALWRELRSASADQREGARDMMALATRERRRWASQVSNVDWHPDRGRLFPCICTVADHQQTLAPVIKGQCGLSDRQRQLRLATWPGHLHEDAPLMRDAAQRWLDGALPWLVICGGTGTGKTLLTATLINELVENLVWAHYTPLDALLKYLKAGINAHVDSTSFDDRLSLLINMPVLAIDDVRTESLRDFGMDYLTMILDQRYLNMAPTIVATNEPFEALPKRIASRLQDPRIADTVIVLAHDVRVRDDVPF